MTVYVTLVGNAVAVADYVPAAERQVVELIQAEARSAVAGAEASGEARRTIRVRVVKAELNS